jgi:hypothetical protein
MALIACERLGGGGRPAGGGLAGRSPATAKQALPATNHDGEDTKMKRRTRGMHLGARKGGKGTGEGDRDGSGGGAPGSGGDGAAVREEERGEVRETQGMMLPLYRAEREGERARRRWSGSSPAGH